MNSRDTGIDQFLLVCETQLLGNRLLYVKSRFSSQKKRQTGIWAAVFYCIYQHTQPLCAGCPCPTRWWSCYKKKKGCSHVPELSSFLFVILQHFWRVLKISSAHTLQGLLFCLYFLSHWVCISPNTHWEILDECHVILFPYQTI